MSFIDEVRELSKSPVEAPGIISPELARRLAEPALADVKKAIKREARRGANCCVYLVEYVDVAKTLEEELRNEGFTVERSLGVNVLKISWAE